MWLFGLLEVVADAARVDAEQLDLPRLCRAGRVPRRWLQLRFEILRQPEANGLLRIGVRAVGDTVWVDRVCERARPRSARPVLVADPARYRVPAPGAPPQPR